MLPGPPHSPPALPLAHSLCSPSSHAPAWGTGWPSLPRAFLVFKLKVSHPRKPSVSGESGLSVGPPLGQVACAQPPFSPCSHELNATVQCIQAFMTKPLPPPTHTQAVEPLLLRPTVTSPLLGPVGSSQAPAQLPGQCLLASGTAALLAFLPLHRLLLPVVLAGSSFLTLRLGGALAGKVAFEQRPEGGGSGSRGGGEFQPPRQPAQRP